MTTSEMIIRAKADFDEVYNAGYEKGKSEGGTDLLQYATFTNGNIFRSAVFPDEIAENIYFKIQGINNPTIVQAVGLSLAFMASNVKNIAIEIIGSMEKGVTFNNVFQSCTDLVSVTFANDVFYIGNGASTFNGATKLERINGVMDLSLAGNISGMFQKCNSLKEVRFAQGSIYKSISFSDSSSLSDKSTENIINGLADLTGQTSQSLSVHGDVFNRMTAEQKSSIANKNWTLSAVA